MIHINARTVEAGEMHGFKVINIFPDTCTEEEWADFADAVSMILKEPDIENRALA